jgi:acetyl/propionyl-CoA carboxylase alpha subunit
MDLIARVGAGRVERVSIERETTGADAADTAVRYRIAVGERVHAVDARSLGPFVKSLVVDGESHETAVFRAGERWRVGWHGRTAEIELVDPLTHLAEEAHGAAGHKCPQKITAYMPGRVVSVAVEPGQQIEAGQQLVVLEAMKMQNEIQSDRAGKVTRVHVEPGQAVEGGDPLLDLE